MKNNNGGHKAEIINFKKRLSFLKIQKCIIDGLNADHKNQQVLIIYVGNYVIIKLGSGLLIFLYIICMTRAYIL